MPDYDLFIFGVSGTHFSAYAICTNIASAIVLSVAVAIGGDIMKFFVLGGVDEVIIVAVIDIFIPWISFFFPLGLMYAVERVRPFVNILRQIHGVL